MSQQNRGKKKFGDGCGTWVVATRGRWGRRRARCEQDPYSLVTSISRRLKGDPADIFLGNLSTTYLLSLFFPQQSTRGKVLFMTIRYDPESRTKKKKTTTTLRPLWKYKSAKQRRECCRARLNEGSSRTVAERTLCVVALRANDPVVLWCCPVCLSGRGMISS